MYFRRSLTVILLGAVLASCSGGTPTVADVEKRFGFKVKDLSCVEAVGKPGYMCTFSDVDKGWSFTRRFVKTDSGEWSAPDGN